MMNEHLFKLKPGQSLEGIPHKAWNAFVEAAQYVKRLQHSLSVDPLRHVPQTGIVRLKNASGQDRQRFDVLGVDDVFPYPTPDPSAFKAGPVLHGVKPYLDTHRGKFAILLEPAPNGSIVSACVSGISIAKINVEQGQEWMEYADVKDQDAGCLQARCHGAAKIFWREPGTGVRWAVARLSNLPMGVYGAGWGAGQIAPYAVVPCSTAIYQQGILLQNQGLKCPEAGLYQFGFQATLAAPAAPRNAILRMQLFVGESATSWIGYRENWRRDVCELSANCKCDNTPALGDRTQPADGYYCQDQIWHTAENVAVSGLVVTPEDNTLLTVRNTGMYTFTASAFQFWARKIPD